MDLKKNVRKKTHEILIFLKKNKVICLPKSREWNTERFRPNAKKMYTFIRKNNTDNTLFFVFTLNQ